MDNEKSAIVKRSVVLDGHKTSVSLENEFWNALREIASREKEPLSKLVRRIDHGRTSINLSSAIRVFLLNYFRGQDTRPVITPADGHKSSGLQQHTGY
jgi:predicted DNA-binding ribbon-helix-helix protein